MKEEKDYLQDIAEIRSMMERSTKFLSLSGLSGVMAGVYALTGAYYAHKILGFSPQGINYIPNDLTKLMSVAITVLVLTLATATILSYRKAQQAGERIWNATARRLLINMAVPLLVGGVLILLLIINNLMGLLAPFSLIFYGLALYNASKFTFEDLRSLAIIEITLGLISAYFVSYGLLLWAIGFGLVHVIYGIYIYYRYEK